MEICQTCDGELLTVVQRYVHTDASRPPITLVAEAPLGSFGHYLTVERAVVLGSDIWAIDMPYAADRPMAARHKRTVEKLQLLTTVQAALAKSAGLWTRHQEGPFDGAHNVGLSFSDMARNMSSHDRNASWWETKRLKALYDTPESNTTHRDYARSALHRLDAANSPHEQARAAKRAAAFVASANKFLHATQQNFPTASISLAVQLHHFATLAQQLEADGYSVCDINWLHCAYVNVV